MKAFLSIILMSVATISVSAQTYTLEQCKELAWKHNASMAKAENNVAAAKEQKKEAYTNYFPQVSATGGWVNGTQDMLSAKLSLGDNAAKVTTLKHATIAGVTAVQPIFMGGQIVNGNKLAKVGVEVSELQKQVTRNDIELTTEKYYWQVVTLQEKLNTVESVEAMLAKLEKDAAMAVKAGIKQRNDLLQVQLKQNEMADTHHQLENGISLSKQVLAQYIGSLPPTPSQEGGDAIPFEIASPFSNSDSTTVALTSVQPLLEKEREEVFLPSLPEYKLLQANVKAKELQRKMEYGKMLPSVAVGASYNYYNAFNNDRNFGTVFATVSVPLSGWWGGTHAVRRQKTQERNAKEDLKDNSELLVIRMQKSYDDLDNAYNKYQTSLKSMEQAKENLRLNENFYKAGTVNMTDLLQAQSLYQQAMDNHTEAYANYMQSLTEYRIATGR